MSFTPAPYQTKAAKAIANDWRWHECVLLIQPTGSRKTATSLMAVEQWSASQKRALRVLAISPLADVVEQWVATVEQHFPALGPVGMVGNEAHDYDRRFVACTYASAARGKTRKAMGKFDVVLIDEAHRSLSYSGHEIVNYYLDQKCKVLKMTATPLRSDGQTLAAYAEKVSATVTAREMEREAVLVKPQVKHIRVKRYNWDDVVQVWQRHAASRSTVCFVDTKLESSALANAFRSQGVAAESITSDNSRTERRSALERARNGELQVLVTVRVLAEGVDVPRLSCAVVCKRFGYQTPYLQATGRILRSFPFKEEGLILAFEKTDHIDKEVSFDLRNTEKIKNGIQNKTRGSGSNWSSWLNERLNKEIRGLMK